MIDTSSPDMSKGARRLRARLALLGHVLPPRERVLGGAEHGAMSAAAALIAYLPTQALGLREGFWSAITAIAVVQNQFGATRTTAQDQFMGAAIGGVIGVGVGTVLGSGLPGCVISVLVAILVCWIFGVATAARLSGTTATIILLVPHPNTSLQTMMLSRLFEVAWGVLIAITVVWVVSRIGGGDTHPKQNSPQP